MDKLVKNVYAQQQEIEKESKIQNPILQFYHQFFQKYRISRVENLFEMDPKELALALVLRNKKPEYYSALKTIIDENENLFENASKETEEEFKSLIYKIDEAELLPIVATKLASGEKTSTISKLFSEVSRYTDALAKFAKKYSIEPTSFGRLLEVIIEEAKCKIGCDSTEEKGQFSFLQAFTFLTNLNEYKKSRKNFESKVDEFERATQILHLSTKEKAKMIQWYTEDEGWQTQLFLSQMRAVFSTYDSLQQVEKSKTKANNRLMRDQNKVIDMLSRGIKDQEHTIKIPEKELSRIPAAAVRHDALRVIYQHNLPICIRQQQKYENAMQNAHVSYSLLLSKYDIQSSAYDVDTIKHQSIEDVEQILKKLRQIFIQNSDMIIYILQNSNVETVSNYVSLVSKGIITSYFLINNPSLFDIESKDYENAMRNLAAIKANHLNPHLLAQSEDVLLTPNETLQLNLETIKDYKIASLLKTGMNVGFLKNGNLSESIDTLLELGYESILEEYPEILNYQDKFNRLRVLKALNIPLETKEEMLEVLTSNKFYIPDSEVENYLPNAVNYNLPQNITLVDSAIKREFDLSSLEKFSKTARTYEIGGVTISKNRVKRNMNTLSSTVDTKDKFMYSILSGAVLTKEEVQSIKNAMGESKASQLKKAN